MDGNGMDTEAGRIDVVSCGIGFPKDAETLGLIGRSDVVYGSRALLAACPVEARLTRIIGAKAREDAADALTLCRVGRHVVVLASGDALYHGFGGTLSGMAHPDDTIVYHPGITAFQALFHRLGLPWQDARLFSAHSGEALPARAIAEAPLSVAYAGSRYPAHAISQAVLKLHPASAGRAAVIAERLGSPEERLFSGPLADLARTECGPTSILLLLPTPWHCVPHTVARIAHDARPDSGIHEGSPISHSIPAPILTLGFRHGARCGTSGPEAVPWGSKPPDCGPTSTSSASSANPNAARSSSVTAPVWASPIIRSTSATPLNSSMPHP